MNPYSMHNSYVIRAPLTSRDLRALEMDNQSRVQRDDPLSAWQRVDDARATKLLKQVERHLWPFTDRQHTLALLDRLESHWEWVAAGRP